jgi:hypothetical protein
MTDNKDSVSSPRCSPREQTPGTQKFRVLFPGGLMVFNSIEERDVAMERLRIDKPTIYQKIMEYQEECVPQINEFNTLADFVRNEIGIDL